jgi:origin recognition complex subunit 4
VEKYFKEQKDMCILFILEDIDFYIETTKQMMLYKILDMLQYAKIPFVFMATSQKVDIVDSFEKRIKSRFSGRMILFYEERLMDFITRVREMFTENFT